MGRRLAPVSIGLWAAAWLGGGAATSGCQSPPPPQPAAFVLEGVATWRGDATAAYSIIHDDVCDAGALGVFSTAAVELERRGLHAGFGVVVSACEAPGGGRWADVARLVAHGHDVFSHSWDHACLTRDATLGEACDTKARRSVDFATEIGRAARTLEAATGLAQQFFIFPYDVCDPAAVTYLQKNGYLGARCGELGINAAAFVDPFHLDHDVFGPSYSRYFGAAACAKTARGGRPKQFVTPPAEYSEPCRRYVLDRYVDDAISAKGWGIRELHGLDPVDPKGWETVSLSDYRAHLDYIAKLADARALWVEGPTTVMKYRFARTSCSPPPIVVAGRTLRFSPPTAECRRHATVLTYRVATVDGSDLPRLAVRQAERVLPARRISAGHYLVEADPSRGDAVLFEPAPLARRSSAD
jgi:peptidoglycan/xylan/chitin deacetylase (PgdA/CDA1 family)